MCTFASFARKCGMRQAGNMNARIVHSTLQQSIFETILAESKVFRRPHLLHKGWSLSLLAGTEVRFFGGKKIAKIKKLTDIFGG